MTANIPQYGEAQVLDASPSAEHAAALEAETGLLREKAKLMSNVTGVVTVAFVGVLTCLPAVIYAVWRSVFGW